MIVEYDNQGRIFHVMEDPYPSNTLEHLLSLGRNAFETKDKSIAFGTHYVVDGEVVLRPTLPDLDGDTISPVPNGTKVYLNGSNIGTVEEGQVSLEGSTPGQYELRLEPPFPTQSRTYLVNVS